MRTTGSILTSCAFVVAGAALALLVATKVSMADEPVSVNDTMINVITPATNTLWGVEDPQTEADWKELADAAALVVEAARSIRQGGSGSKDMQWSANPDWQAFADRLIAAAEDASAAAKAMDLESLLDANDVLYPPCEECHLQFHPGVNGDDLN